MPFIQEFGPFYFHLGKLSAKRGGWTVPVRQYEWPFKRSTGLVLKLRGRGLLVGIWRKNSKLYELDEEELLLQAMQATAVGYFQEQQIGKAGNIEWVPIESVRDKDRNW